MECTRCQGFMVKDLFLDCEGPRGHMWTTRWCCVHCGHAHNSVMEHNPLRRDGEILVFHSGEPDYDDDEVHLGREAIVNIAA